MVRRKLLAAVHLVAWALPALVAAEEVRYYEQDGITYRESRRVIRRPVAETQYQEHPRTIYREQLNTEVRDVVRTYHVPVTEYHWQSYWRGRFNPFVQPYLAQQLVPCTRWETRTEVVSVPVTRREVVPETSTVRVPVTTHRMVEEEVISRMAVNAPSSDPFAPRLARPGSSLDGRIGGIANLDKDPPRRGSIEPGQPTSGSRMASGERSESANSQWRAADERKLQ